MSEPLVIENPVGHYWSVKGSPSGVTCARCGVREAPRDGCWKVPFGERWMRLWNMKSCEEVLALKANGPREFYTPRPPQDER